MFLARHRHMVSASIAAEPLWEEAIPEADAVARPGRSRPTAAAVNSYPVSPGVRRVQLLVGLEGAHAPHVRHCCGEVRLGAGEVVVPRKNSYVPARRAPSSSWRQTASSAVPKQAM